MVTDGSARTVGPTRLIGRQFLADPRVSALLAVVVLMSSLLVSVAPGLVQDMNDRQAAHVIDNLSPLRRDLTASAVGYVQPAEGGASGPAPVVLDGAGPPPSTEAPWAAMLAALQQVGATEPLSSILQPGSMHVDLDTRVSGLAPPGSSVGAMRLTVRIDPGLVEHVELVRGDWPAVVVNEGQGFSILRTDPAASPDDLPDFNLVEVVVLDETAHELNWQVGQRWGPLLLTGTYRPLDADDPRWAHATDSISMGMLQSEGGKIATVAGYLAPASTGQVDSAPTTLRLRFYRPIDTAHLRGDQVAQLARQLEQLSAQPEAMGQSVVVTFDAESLDQFHQLLDQQRATVSVLTLVAVGPVGVLLAVLILGTRLIWTRRSSTLTLAAARGASPRQVRGLLAAEGALLGLPAAGAGWWLAGRLAPSTTGWRELAVAVGIGLLPAVTLALSSRGSSLGERRQDLTTRSRGRLRVVAEVAWLALTALAVWRLLTRGLVGVQPVASVAGSGGASAATDVATSLVQVETGGDPLAAAAPLLVAVAASLVTLRIYPGVVRGLTAVLRRSRGLAGFVGAARAERDPAVGLIPILSVVLGVAVGVSAVALSSTITHGATAAAWERAGADLRASGPAVGLEDRQALAEIEGVSAVASAREMERTTTLSAGISADSVRIVVIDDEMEQVSSSAGPLTPLPAELFEVTSPAPILTVGQLTQDSGQARMSQFGQVEVVGHRATLPGVRTRGETVVMSASNWQAVRGRFGAGNAVLISLTGEVPVVQVREAVTTVLPTALVETPELEQEQFEQAPVSSGLTAAFGVAVAVTTALTTLAILLAHQLGAPARARMLAVLRTLGMAPRQGRALTAWEFGPLVATAMLVGVVAGGALSWLLLRTVDLTGLTGGETQPTLHVDGTLLGVVLAIMAATSVAAVTVAAVTAGRSDLAQVLRIGGDR